MSSSSGANSNMAKAAAVLAAAMLGIAVLMFANGQIALWRPKLDDDDDNPPRQRSPQPAPTDQPAAASAPAAPPAPLTEQELVRMQYEHLGAEGVAAFRAGNYDEAVARFTEALALGQTHEFLTPQQRFIYQNRSASFDKMGRIKEALDDCAKILVVDPENKRAKARRERLYNMLIEKGDLQEAVVELMVNYTLLIDRVRLQVLMGQNPDVPAGPEDLEPLTTKIGNQMFEELEASGGLNLSKALPGSHTLKQILRMLPSYTSLLARMGDLRPIESITADIDALPAEAEAERTPLYFERALVYVADGRFKRADEDLDRACTAVMNEVYDGPKSADILSWGGLFTHLRNSSDRAMTMLKKARELNIADSEICVKLSAVHLDKEEVEDGKRMLAIAEQLAPNDPYLQCWIAQSHIYGATDMQVALEATAEAYKKALQCDENFVPALQRLAHTEIQLGHLEEAERHLTKARRLAPRDSDVVMVYAALLGTRNDADGAVRQLDKALRLEPGNTQPYFQKAQIALETGNMTEALDQLRQLLDADPTFIPAHMLRVQLYMQSDLKDAEMIFQLIEGGLAVARTKDEVKHFLNAKVALSSRIMALQRLGRYVGTTTA